MHVQPFVKTCAAFSTLDKYRPLIEGAFNNQLNLIKASVVCKKPSDADVLKFLQPCVDLLTFTDKFDFKSPSVNQFQALNNGLQAVNWYFASAQGLTARQLIDVSFVLVTVLRPHFVLRCVCFCCLGLFAFVFLGFFVSVLCAGLFVSSFLLRGSSKALSRYWLKVRGSCFSPASDDSQVISLLRYSRNSAPSPAQF